MNLLKELEKKLERMFEGFFTRSFKSGLQPIELAKRLLRAMEERKVLGVSHVYSPNRFLVKVSAADKEELSEWETVLVRELEELLVAQAKNEGYRLMSRPEVRIITDDSLTLGEFVVEGHLASKTAPAPESEKASGQSEPAVADSASSTAAPNRTRIIPRAEAQAFQQQTSLLVREKSGEVFPLISEVTTIGRSSTNHITIDDPNMSRHHAEIHRQGEGFLVVDLKSTNGTKVNGSRVGRYGLKDGDHLTLGHTDLTFRRSRSV